MATQSPGAPGNRLAAHLGKAAEGRREQTPYERFRAQINLVRLDIGKLVGERNVDRFVRVCLNAVQYNPDLLGADRRTLLLACMDAATDGLIPDGTQAVFNIYSTKVKEGRGQTATEKWVSTVQYLPMAYGLVQKIYESGASFVDAVAVYEKDEFDYQRGDEPRIVHKPYAGTEAPGQVVAAYVVVKYPKLETKREVMFRRDIEKVRGKSKAKDGLMWGEFYDQAAIKSVIHRINKQLPQSDSLNRALAHDNRASGLTDVAIPVEESGTDFASLADGRLEAELRDANLGAGKIVEGQATRIEDPAAASTSHEAAATGGTVVPDADVKTPKPGDPGTPELKAKILGQFERATTTDVLDIAHDDVLFFKWGPADQAELQTAFEARRKAINEAS